MRQSGLEFPVYAIRNQSKEPAQHYPELAVSNTIHLPEKFDDILASDTNFRRSARKWQAELEKMWGYGSAEKHRIYEALWLGPRLTEHGIHHVHVHFAGLAARTAFWLKKIFGIHFSVTAHANDIFRDEPPARLGQVSRRRKSSSPSAISAFAICVKISRYSAENSPGCTNGIATDSFPRSTFPEGAPLIVGVGRYIEKKVSSTSSKPVPALVRGISSAASSVVGRTAMRSRPGSPRLGLEGRVHITGSKFEEEIRGRFFRRRGYSPSPAWKRPMVPRTIFRPSSWKRWPRECPPSRLRSLACRK